MTSTTLPPLSGSTSQPTSMESKSSPLYWVLIAATFAAFVAMFWGVLSFCFSVALKDDDWSHALIVPLISLYFVYQSRDQLAKVYKRICWWGLPILVFGLASYAFWIFPGRNHMLQGYSMIVALFGLVMFLVGWRAMRWLWLPVLYLSFAIKVSDAIWEKIALKLQLIAAAGSTMIINFFGRAIDLTASVKGSTIDLVYKGLPIDPAMEVAQACSGLRMLMAFIALGVAVAFISARPWWQRLVMVASTLPIAVGINVIRVTILGFIYPYDKELASGDFHTFVGMLMLIPAAGMFLLLGWIMDKLFIVKESEESPSTGKSETKAKSKPAQSPKTAVPAKPVTLKQLFAFPGSLSFKSKKTWALLGSGIVLGAVMMGSMVGSYILTISYIRPDLVSLMPSTTTLLLAIAAGLIGIGVMLGVWPIIRKTGVSIVGAAPVVAISLVVSVLCVSAVGQAGVVRMTQAVLVKEEVPLRIDLRRMPSQIDGWRLVHVQKPLPPDVEKTLGTDKYITMTYEDMDLREGEPGRRVRLHVAYYSGTIDTVPHVPDRCFVGGGMDAIDLTFKPLQLDYLGDQKDPETDQWLVPSNLSSPEMVRIPENEFQVRSAAFADRRQPDRTFQVKYFFITNGKFLAHANRVRVEGFNITDRYSYYCKVEVQWFDISDAQMAQQRTEDFMSVALPEIMACLPDWHEVRNGTAEFQLAQTSEGSE